MSPDFQHTAGANNWLPRHTQFLQLAPDRIQKRLRLGVPLDHDNPRIERRRWPQEIDLRRTQAHGVAGNVQALPCELQQQRHALLRQADAKPGVLV